MSTQEDLKIFPLYGVSNGELIPLSLESLKRYTRQTHQIHHYIKQQEWRSKKQWFIDRGIEQKLILLPIWLHEQVHNQAVKNMTDEQFKEKVGLSRWELLFNRRHTEY